MNCFFADTHTGKAPANGPVIQVLAGGLLLGSAGMVSSFAPAASSPIVVGGLRLLIGALALTMALPLLGGSWRDLFGLMRRWTVWVMAAGSALYQPLFFGAIARSGVGISTLIAIGAVPVFAGLIAWAALAQRPTPAWILATLMAVTGLGLRCSGQLATGDGLGVVMALAAALSVGCYVVAAKIELDRGAHPVALPAAAYLLGSALLAPLVLAQPLGWLTTGTGIAVVVYLGVVTMAIGNLLTIRGMRHLPSGPAATLMLTDPVTATLLGVIVLHETIPLPGLAGLAFVLTGLVLQARSLADTQHRQPGRRAEPDAPSSQDGAPERTPRVPSVL